MTDLFGLWRTGRSMGKLTNGRIALLSALLALVFEGLTVLLRFGLGMRATDETASTVGVLTGGIRVHHGYIGALIVLGAFCCLRRWPVSSRWALAFGAALVLSDAIHHFVVLWLVVGSPELDLFYPPK